jgi:hypothetical protein
VPLISLAQQVPDLLGNLIKPRRLLVLVFVISHDGGTHINISFVFVQKAANRNTIYARISSIAGASRAQRRNSPRSVKPRGDRSWTYSST